MGKDDTRARILEAAGPIFAAKGFEGTRVREICERAGVNVAAVNYHFGDKARLYQEAVHWAHQSGGEGDGLLQWPEGTPPAAKLREFIRAMVTRMLGERAPWQRQLIMRELLQPTFAGRELVQGYIRARFGQLLEILDEILPAEVPLPKRHQIAFSIVGQAMHYRVAGEVVAMLVGEEEREAHYGVDELAEHISEFSLAALGLRA